MIVLEYDVYDPLSSYTVLASVLGVEPVPVKVYSKIGEEGLLEDFLTEKGFVFTEPKQVEVPDDFTGFTIIRTDQIKEIDLAKDSGRLIFKKKPLEPSVN